MQKAQNNTMYLISAILNIMAGILFMLSAVFQNSMIPKCGFGVTSLCMLISGIGFLHTYRKNKVKGEPDKL